MKSRATPLGVRSECGQVWPSLTMWDQHLPSVARVKRHTCFSCCCDGSSETVEECGPHPSPFTLHAPPFPLLLSLHAINAVLMNLITQPAFVPLVLCLLTFIRRHYLLSSCVILPHNTTPSATFIGHNMCVSVNVCVSVWVSDQMLLVSVTAINNGHKLDDVPFLPPSILSSHPETQCPLGLPLLTVELIGTWLWKFPHPPPGHFKLDCTISFNIW